MKIPRNLKDGDIILDDKGTRWRFYQYQEDGKAGCHNGIVGSLGKIAWFRPDGTRPSGLSTAVRIIRSNKPQKPPVIGWIVAALYRPSRWTLCTHDTRDKARAQIKRAKRDGYATRGPKKVVL